MGYIIQASKDNVVWRTQATFKKGDPSRFGVPFNEEIVLKEARGFKDVRVADFRYVRVIINI